MKKVIKTMFTIMFLAFALTCIYVSNRYYTVKADTTSDFYEDIVRGRTRTFNGQSSYYITLEADTTYDVKTGFKYSLHSGTNITIDLNNSTLNFGEGYNAPYNNVNNSSFRYDFKSPFFLFEGSKIILKNGKS